MEFEEIRTLTLQALRIFDKFDDNSNNYPELKEISNVLKKVEELDYPRDPNSLTLDNKYGNVTPSIVLDDTERKYFLEAFQDLIRQTGFYPYFSITTYGKKVLQSGEIIPHDPFDYLIRLKKDVPDLDSIVLQYVEESLQCYLNGNLMASSVMLGVASEAAFYQLLNSFKNSIHIDIQAKEKAEKLEKRINITDKFTLVYDEIKRKKKDLEPHLAEVIEYNLNGIFNLIRLQRNESGHPDRHKG